MSFARLYYRVKPFIPPRVRFALRRAWARHLRERCGEVWPIDEQAGAKPTAWPGWPGGEQFALVLSHDVESAIGLGKVRQLAELEMEFGLRSSFNFVPEGDYRVPAELRDWLTAHGFEVGVHDLRHDGRLYDSRQAFAASAERINRYLAEWGASGFRSGFMLHKLDWLHDLDVLYDASTFDTDPFEPQPEGSGTIFPNWVEAPFGGRHDGGGYVELPYTLPQDSTLFLIFGEESPQIWFDKLDWVAERGGMAMINVHPDYIDFETGGDGEGVHGLGTYPVAHYRAFLERVRSRPGTACWPALPKEVAGWYRKEVARPEVRASAPASPRADDACLSGKRAAVLLYSYYPADPRPRRAAEAMVSEGMEVDLLCLRADKDEPLSENVGGVDVTRSNLAHRRSGKLTYLWNYARFILAGFGFLAKRAPSRRYDVIHVHNMPDVLVFSALVPRLMGAKVILDLHDPMPELMRTIYGMSERGLAVRMLKFLEKISIAFSHSVITVNKTCRKIFGARSCDVRKVHVVMNSPDESIFSYREPSVRPDGGTRPFVVMYHGSLVERNGLGLAVEAMAQVRQAHPGAELWVYGKRTKFLEDMLARAAELGIERGVKYVGSRSSEGIAQAIDGCDLGIVPNLRNIFTELNTPTRIFEFLSRGKPVVAPAAPGVQEYFGEDDLISFELGDAGDLAAKVSYAIEHPGEVLEVVKRGQAVCLAHRWSEERTLFLDIVADLLGCSRGSGTNSGGGGSRRGRDAAPETVARKA